jgi:DNA adenine methylase
MTTLLRYPGGKQKLIKPILNLIGLDLLKSTRYVEPFLGGGSMAIEIVKKYPNINEIVLSDIDVNLCALWNSVINNKESLKTLIKDFTPTVESFFKFKEDLQTPDIDPLLRGFKKLAIHQMSYSGLGEKAGGPIGGKAQNSKYLINCRWKPQSLNKKIDEISNIFKKVNFITSQPVLQESFPTVLQNWCNKSTFVYLDPPYYKKGEELYVNSFTSECHLNLRDSVNNLDGRFAISYDKVDEIIRLYSDYKINELKVNYTINTSRNNTEILITNL